MTADWSPLSRIESLERQLAERAEEIRRRDHIIAGFIERLPETLELPASVTPQEAARASEPAQDAPLRDHVAPDPLHPTEVTLGLRVRRWLRRITGEVGR